MVGSIDERLRERLGALLIALARQDADRIADAILALGMARGPTDRQALRADLAGFVARYAGRAVGEIPIARLTEELLAIVRRHRLRLPPSWR